MYRKIGSVANAGVSQAAIELKSNDAYDVDPALGSTETYGFDQYAQLYSYYRVISYSYVITVTNNSGLGTDSPIMMYVLNTNTQPSLSGSRYDLYSTNPHCQSKLLSLPYAAGSNHTMRGTHPISRIVGSKVPETDDSYRGLTTGSPSDLTWLSLAIENPTSGVGVNIVYDMKLVMNVRFYGREVDLSLSAIKTRVDAKVAARERVRLLKEAKEAARKHIALGSPSGALTH
jgi:hypothetical protein